MIHLRYKAEIPKILLVFGSRPEFIKLAPIMAELKADSELIVKICSTGQHRELVDQLTKLFQFHVDYDLGIMRPGKTLTYHCSAALSGLESVISQEDPDLIMVHGDTLSALAGTLAGFMASIPVAHVESGLRSFDLQRPFPEEGFRRLIDVVAWLRFAPTQSAKNNLLREGIQADRIFVSGNTAIDAFMTVLATNYSVQDAEIRRALHSKRPLIVGELHRRENWGFPLESVLMGIKDALQVRRDALLLFSVHPNPRVSDSVKKILHGHEQVLLVKPQPFDQWARILSRASIIVTDSGGVQEEASVLGVPVVLARTETERPEGVEAGIVTVAGTDRDRISKALVNGLQSMERRPKLVFGDGLASVRIHKAIRASFNLSPSVPEEFCGQL